LVLAVVKQGVGAAIASLAVAQNREDTTVVIHVATQPGRFAARLLRRRMQSLKRERHRTLTALRQISKPRFRLFNRRNMARRNPPKRQMWSSHFLEPLLAILQHSQVTAAINVVAQIPDGPPYRQ